MSTIAQHPTSIKIGYKRAQSEPNKSSVSNIRYRFESNSAEALSPELGLAFGVKKSSSSTASSEAASPLVTRKPQRFVVSEEASTVAVISSTSPSNQLSKLNNESTLDTCISQQSHNAKVDKVLNKANKALLTHIVTEKANDKPNSLIISNGTQTTHSAIAETAFSNSTAVLNSHKQVTVSFQGSLATIPCPNASIFSTDSCVNQTSTEPRTFEQTTNLSFNAETKLTKERQPRLSTSSELAEGSSNSKNTAKHFWRNLSFDTYFCKNDSILEPGMDYTKLKKHQEKKTDKSNLSSPLKKNKFGLNVSSGGGQLTATDLKSINDSLTTTESDGKFHRLNSQTTEGFKSPVTTLSTSSSVSSMCSSMDSIDAEYLNGSISQRVRRRDTKPPTNIVARRTQLFEKSLEELNSVSEEAEAFHKVKETGFGTVFKPKDPSAVKPAVNKPKVISSVPQSNPPVQPKPKHLVKQLRNSQLPHGKRSSDSLNNNNTKLANKNISSTKPFKLAGGAIEKLDTKPNLTNFGSTAQSKSSPLLPATDKKGTHLIKPPIIASKPKTASAPPKPPRTFEHLDLSRSSSELTFDPVYVPRQAGDGEENSHGYETHVSCSNPHLYTSVVLPADGRPYTATTSADTRSYTSLTTAAGSEGDDSVAGSENAYDTLGRASVASSYEHYDTISQSELDSDVSRPPTLPRRPSNLRHRPVTTAFGNIDIAKSVTNAAFQNQLQKALASGEHTIKETSPTSPSPTKVKVPFKLKYLLPKARRKTDEIRKASSMANLLDNNESPYDPVEFYPSSATSKNSQTPLQPPPDVPLDEAGYALPDIKGNTWQTADGVSCKPGEPQPMAAKSQVDKTADKIRLKLNQAFSALRKSGPITPTPASDGEEEEKVPGPEVLEERLKHCTSVKEHAIYASAAQIKGFITQVYAQLYDYAVIVGLRKTADSLPYEPYVKYKFPPQISVEQTTVPQFCYPDAHIWQKCTEYKSESFSFVLTDVTGTRQYGYCRRVLPPDLSNQPRTPEVICVVSPLNATKLYNQVLDEVEKRRMQNSLRAEEFLQAVYGRPMPSPGQSVTIRAMNVYEEAECLTFTRSPDSQREGIDYECLLNTLSVSQIIKIFASILLERKIIFIAERLSILSSCVHAFASLIYPFSWQHTFIPLLPPNLIDVVCAPTPYIVGLLSSNAHLLHSIDDEMDEVLIVDFDNHKFLQRTGDEKLILPKKLHRALITALDMAKSEGQSLRSLMVPEAFLRFFLETTGSFNDFMIHVPGAGRQFQKEEFVCKASNAPSIMVFLQWFTETQMFEVYTTERENDRNVVLGTFEEKVLEFQSEDHGELFSDHRRFKKFKLFGKNKKK